MQPHLRHSIWLSKWTSYRKKENMISFFQTQVGEGRRSCMELFRVEQHTFPGLPRTCSLSLGSTGSWASQGSASFLPLPSETLKRDSGAELRCQAQSCKIHFCQEWEAGEWADPQVKSSQGWDAIAATAEYSALHPLLISCFDRQCNS